MTNDIELTDAVRFLLANGYSDIHKLAAAITGLEIVDDCLVDQAAGWVCDWQGTCERMYLDATTAAEAAEEYFATGTWGDKNEFGTIDIDCWRCGVNSLGEDVRVGETTITIDLLSVYDHAAAIAGVMGTAGCGSDPADHDWTSEGEGGCRDNPGVWHVGGTTFRFATHCRKCGLRRVETHRGTQRNPGEGDEVHYSYEESTDE